MQIFFYITVNVALIIQCFLKVTLQNNEKLNSKLDNDTRQLFCGSPINKQKSFALPANYQHSRFIQVIKCNALHHWKVQII